ncbi:MAG: 50S ribosomal protein L21 [Patescibacteria group bacterium]
MAVIRTGGKQYIVKPQQRVTVEKLLQKVGDVLTFEDVLLITDAENQAVKVGAPVVIGASVTAKVLKQGRTEKVPVVKFKSKTRQMRQKTHRQYQTTLEITEIKA